MTEHTCTDADRAISATAAVPCCRAGRQEHEARRGEELFVNGVSMHKYAAVVPASWEALLDAGAATEEEARAAGWTPYVPPPLTRKQRWRMHWNRLRSWTTNHLPHVHIGPCDHEECW